MVLPNMISLHTDPKYWGADAALFKPQRWIRSRSNDTPHKQASLENEYIWDPPRGTYFPWSEGTRVCLGKTFSQVEFAAVLAVLFRSHVVQPRPNERENIEGARRRFLTRLQEHQFMIAVQLRDPESLVVTWSPRESVGL